MKPSITVVPLGPGDPSLMTMQTADLLQSGRHRIVLRTARHPAASWMEKQGISFEAMDVFYDQYDDFDRMHEAMARWLWAEAAGKGKSLALCVPDPSADRLTDALRLSLPEGADLRFLPGVSMGNVLLASLPPGIQRGSGILQTTATGFLAMTGYDPECSLLITELDSALLAGDIKIRLSDLLPEEQEILFFPPSNRSPRPFRILPLYQLDAGRDFDHTAALFIPGSDYLHRNRHSFQDLTRIMNRLRAPDGCPWDRVQTHASLRPYLVEEAWEAIGAINDEDPDHLADELGDVLFQVFFHASIGESCGEFSMADVVSGICRKMIQRHPHVFVRTLEGATAAQIAEGWEAGKRAETGSKTVGDTLEDVSASLPSLKYAIKMYKKLAQIPALRRDPETIRAEMQKLVSSLLPENRLSPEAMGDLLRKCAELCFRTDQDAEILLRASTEKMKKEWQNAEKAMIQEKKSPESLTIQQLYVYLEQARGKVEKTFPCPDEKIC